MSEEETEGIDDLNETEHEEVGGYRCVKCEEEVQINPVEEKIICPKCSHRVLFKTRSENPERVEAV